MVSITDSDVPARQVERAQNNECRRFGIRACAVTASLAVSLVLSGCGGGGDTVTFDVGVLVGGQPLSGVMVQPGGVQNISVSAGQSIELDANEPVQWTLRVGGSDVTGSGATVYYQGISITVTALSRSRIALDTSAAGPLAVAVPITLTATSTIDSAFVATMNVLITN